MKYALNIGCGSDFRKSTPDMEWINLDANPEVKAAVRWPIDRLTDVYREQFDHIEANDILEHVPYSLKSLPDHWRKVLKSWIACLKPGGTIRIQVPDPNQIFGLYQRGEFTEEQMNRVIYGENTNGWERHYQMFSLARMEAEMKALGLEIVEARNLHVCAIVIGRKMNL